MCRGNDTLTDSTTQKLKTKTLERLQKHGKMGDTFDDVLNKVLDKLEGKKN